MKIATIVQARMTSTRFPGKVLKEVLGKSLLEYQIERLKRSKYAGQIIIATTTNKKDEPIISLCKKLNMDYFRGSENDVLSRYYETALQFKIDIIVRITSDCPIIDPQVVDETIQYYFDHIDKCDYVSNGLKDSYPSGMDTEVFSIRSLKEAFFEATEQYEREHVTPFIYKHPQRYRLVNVSYFENQSCHRWTVDTLEDFELIRNIITELYPAKPNFNMQDCLNLLARYPDWNKINSHVKQKVCF